MTDWEDAIEEALEEADGMGSGPAQLALLQEAVNIADQHNDPFQGYRTRMALLDAAQGAGEPDVMLVAFSWCLAQSDREPEEFPDQPLLWKHRWVIFSLPVFPQVSRAQIEASLADMEQRYRRVGSTLRGYHLLRRNVAFRMGDRALAAEAHRAWQDSKRDWLSDGAANEQDFLVEYLVFAGEDAEAVKKAQPLLTGRFRSTYEPTSTYPELLLPLLRLGKVKEALEYHRQGWRLLAGQPVQHNLTEYADHLTFLALTENWGRAVTVLEKVLPAAQATVSLSLRFDYYHAARLLLDRLSAQGQSTLQLRLPAASPLHEKSGHHDARRLLAWLDGELHDLAGRFDARNGNDYFHSRLTDLEKLKTLATPAPLE